MEEQNRYIGVEQEFTSFNGINNQIDIRDRFGRINKFEGSYFDKGGTTLRSKTGHAVYADGKEVEVCTPPVRINQGFASRLTDLIIIGREKIVQALPNLKHTGYSMHWNLSSNKVNPYFYSGIAIPFHLFGLTPLSGGLNVRTKCEDASGTRVEVLGDAITNEEQINATALMLGSFIYACDIVKGFPLIMERSLELPVNCKQDMFLYDGRYSNVEVSMLEENDRIRKATITAQTALECFYESIKPIAIKLGTEKEVENLEDFIYGEKELEFDKFKFFACMKSFGGMQDNGIYSPIELPGKENPNRAVTLSGKKRTLPIEGRLLGRLMEKKLEKLVKMDWGSLTFTHPQNINGENFTRSDAGSRFPYTVYVIEGIDQMYHYAAKLLGEEKLTASPSTQELREADIMGKKFVMSTKGPKSYNPDNDKFELPGFFVLKNAIKNKGIFSKDGLIRIAVTTAILGAISLGGNLGYQWYQTLDRTDEIVKRYTQPSTNIVLNVESNSNAQTEEKKK